MLKKLEMVEYILKSSSSHPSTVHSPEAIVIKAFHSKDGTLERAEKGLSSCS
jgi:hypothetical protein